MKGIRFITALLGFCLIAACGPSDQINPASVADVVSTSVAATMAASGVSDSASSPKNASADKKTPGVINPLTGLTVDDPSLLERRPVMVKVSNFPRLGLPHAGLSFADIVFDYFIGYGTNRFLAVFYGQDSPSIGPVRSGRRVDAQLVNMYNGILGYGSADNDTDEIIVSKLGDYAISNLEASCPVFCGTDTHDVLGVFANSHEISKYVDQLGLNNEKPDLPNMVFSESAPADGLPGEKLTVLFNFYNRAEWRFDSQSGKYLRWIEYMEDDLGTEYEMIPLVDRVTGEQLAFSNVIVIFANYTELAPSAHEIDIWGNDRGKKAYFFRDGVMTKGKWKAKNDSDPMEFLDADGQSYRLKPGNTWIVIMGSTSTFTESAPGNWETVFLLP